MKSKFGRRPEFREMYSKGEPFRQGDIQDIETISVEPETEPDSALIIVWTRGWKRSLYYDFGPLHGQGQRLSVSQAIATQLLSLYGHLSSPPTVSESDEMANGFRELRDLLAQKDEEEEKYQTLLERHPWMLGGIYQRIHRHTNLDNANIPDFTAERSSDGTLDCIELKHPFIRCFRQDGALAAELNAAWNQAERYLAFARENRDYLLREKSMKFEYPRCILLAGYSWSEPQWKAMRPKIAGNPSVQLMTYDQLVNQTQRVLSLVRTAQARP